MNSLDKYKDVGSLELLAAYIQHETHCCDCEAWDMAYELFDSLDRMIEYKMEEDEE